MSNENSENEFQMNAFSFYMTQIRGRNLNIQNNMFQISWVAVLTVSENNFKAYEDVSAVLITFFYLDDINICDLHYYTVSI